MSTSKKTNSFTDLKSDSSKSVYTSSESTNNELLFGKQFYMWMLLGLGLIAIGMLLMSGGHMPSNDVWDENIIYGARRTIIAPLFMLAGLIVEVYAIFKK